MWQGYVESINPDSYERALRRYLAEGDSLWNAHNNAVADANPWFTIVIEYGPPLYCFNLLRLAPMHVDTSAPSHAWRNATIAATVRNQESARHRPSDHEASKMANFVGPASASGMLGLY